MTIDELKQHCESETKNIDRVLNELFSVYTSDKSEYTLAEQASIAALLMNVYSGIENILKHMLVYDRLDVGDAPEWHEKVLRKASEMGIVPCRSFRGIWLSVIILFTTMFSVSTGKT
jgi:hypothetical protein